jgi:hypothetical protein
MQPSQQPAARPRWLRWLLGGIAILSIACVAAIGLLWLSVRDSPLLGGYQEDLTTQQIEGIGRIKLPPSAAGVHARAGGFQDRYIHIRFDITPADLEPFMKGTRYTPSIGPAKAIPFQSIAPDAPWWRPQDAQRYQAGVNFVDGISQTVLVDMTNPGRYIVYVQTFET